jgi:hypothetical protein
VEFPEGVDSEADVEHDESVGAVCGDFPCDRVGRVAAVVCHGWSERTASR